MYRFESEGYEVEFDDEGEGGPIILLHGSAADRRSDKPNDTVVGSPIPLAESIPGAKAVIVPGRSHLFCIADDFSKRAVMGFPRFC